MLFDLTKNKHDNHLYIIQLTGN